MVPVEAKLVLFKADGQRREFALENRITLLGRKPSCHLRIPLPSISREHSRIEIKGEELYLTDLGSSNGTFCNDQRVKGEVKLSAGDTIKVGPACFTLVVNGEPSDIQPLQRVMPEGEEEFSVIQGNPADASEEESGAPAEPAASDAENPLAALGEALGEVEEASAAAEAKSTSQGEPAAKAPDARGEAEAKGEAEEEDPADALAAFGQLGEDAPPDSSKAPEQEAAEMDPLAALAAGASSPAPADGEKGKEAGTAESKARGKSKGKGKTKAKKGGAGRFLWPWKK